MRGLAMLLVLVALLGMSAWLAEPPMLRALPEAIRLWRLPAPDAVAVPVRDVAARRIADTWGAQRSGGRRHEGTDIFAPRGTPVLSATRGIVVRIGEGGIGGRVVWVLGPGGERHYYAHLDDWAPGLHHYQVVRTGDPLGIVGDTGNARGTPPHLHYGIYAEDGARNPHPRLRDPDRPVDPPHAR